MKALCIDAPNTIALRDVAEPPLNREAGECRVAVRVAGICRTDLELARGYMNFTGIPGHEFVGTVREGPEHLIGRRVVGEINAACGNCRQCQLGMGRHCAHRTVLGIYKRPGAFAESLALPAPNLIAVPDSVSDEEAVFTEPLAAALEIFEQVHVPPGSRMLVIGDGKLGLLVAQVCAHFGARVTLHGRHEKKLALARRWTVDAVSAEPRGDAERYPFVAECTGTPAALAVALDWTAPRGTLILKSTYAVVESPAMDWTRVVVDEISIVGSRCGQFAPALRLLAQHKIDVRSLIDHRLPLSDAPDAFARAASKGTLKVLLQVATSF